MRLVVNAAGYCFEHYVTVGTKGSKKTIIDARPYECQRGRFYNCDFGFPQVHLRHNMLHQTLLRDRKTATPSHYYITTGKLSRRGFICGTFLLMLFVNLTTHAQNMKARISVVSLTPPRVKVEAERTEGTKIWSFRDAYAGIIASAGASRRCRCRTHKAAT